MKIIKISLFLMFALSASDAVGFKLGLTDQGKLIRWYSEKIVVYLDPSLDELGEKSLVETEIIRAFDTWFNAVDFPFDLDFEARNCLAISEAVENVCCIYAKEKSGEASLDIGATTFVSYVEDTGNIIHGDIAMFTDAASWSTHSEPGALDVYSVTLHEAGHLLGIEHSSVEEAVMFPQTSMDKTGPKDLHDDDKYAAGALYDERRMAGVNCSAGPGIAKRIGVTSLLIDLFIR